MTSLFRRWLTASSATAPLGSHYGIIHIRTDGDRVLTFTHSGKNPNEVHRFAVRPHGEVQLAANVEKRSTPPK